MAELKKPQDKDKKGWTQEDLENKSGADISTVKRFLRRQPIDTNRAIWITQALGFELTEVIEPNESNSPIASSESEQMTSIKRQENELDGLEAQKARSPQSGHPQFQALSDEKYVERPPLESDCYETILEPGSLLRIKAPQQFGKTWLLSRVLGQVESQGYRTLTLSFELLADNTVFSDLCTFLKSFCVGVGQELGLPNQLADYWEDLVAANYNSTAYFQKYLLPQIHSPLVLALDKVDLVFEHPEIATDFCKLLRGWHEQARRGDRSSEAWKKLRLVVVHSTEVYGKLDINHSPLGGVGVKVDLPEFTTEQVQKLAHRYRLNWHVAQLRQLMAIVGGHPYLVQLALEHIGRQNFTLEKLLQDAPTEAGIYRDHLRRHLANLKQHPELEVAFSKLVNSPTPLRLEPEQTFKLYSMGLVQLQGNEVKPRCDLYCQYFRNHLRVTE
jgi:transcriptional regulator with XRE-family HTH domain